MNVQNIRGRFDCSSSIMMHSMVFLGFVYIFLMVGMTPLYLRKRIKANAVSIATSDISDLFCLSHNGNGLQTDSDGVVP